MFVLLLARCAKLISEPPPQHQRRKAKMYRPPPLATRDTKKPPEFKNAAPLIVLEGLSVVTLILLEQLGLLTLILLEPSRTIRVTTGNFWNLLEQ